nr:hypothetical protein [Tanacetum cinerariifolium]
MWELAGLPCVHVVAGYILLKKDHELGVTKWFSKNKWFESYQYSIRPVPGTKLWKKSDLPKPLPPGERKLPGRPRKRRIRHPSKYDHEISRVGRVMHCHRCWHSGHNKSKCTNAPKPKPKPDNFYEIPIDEERKHRSNNMVDQALELFDKIIEKGICANVITYNSLIHGLCNFGRESKAAKLLIDMEEKHIYPNTRTYNIIVNALCKQGSVKDAELAVQAMVRKGLHPSLITYSALIDGYCLRGELDDAKKVFDLILEKNIVPNIIIYNSLIHGYCKKKRVDEAMDIFQEVPNKGLTPDIVSYSSMMQ